MAPLDLKSFNRHTTTAVRRQELNPRREHRHTSWVRLQIRCSFNGRRCRVQISTCHDRFEILLHLPHGAWSPLSH